jgi:hypothetical protein
MIRSPLRLPYLARNARAGDLLELFFVSAVASLLLTRFYLSVTGYPQIGGLSLHVAHMLPGGLLMMASIVGLLSTLGHRSQQLAAVAGGIGFGLFIDELGKFITHDNNYFFQPTVALLYLIFAGLLISFRSLSRRRQLSQQEYLLNALSLMEEAVMNDLDRAERQRVLEYLKQADQRHPLVQSMTAAFEALPALPAASYPRLLRLRRAAEERYRLLIQRPLTIKVIDAVFVAKAVLSVASISLVIINFFTEPASQDVAGASYLQFASSAVATIIIAYGVVQMRSNRLRAYELFLKATLIDIFFTQFFAFYREGFSAIPGFIAYILIYVTLRILITEERRLRSLNPSPSA